MTIDQWLDLLAKAQADVTVRAQQIHDVVTTACTCGQPNCANERAAHLAVMGSDLATAVLRHRDVATQVERVLRNEICGGRHLLDRPSAN